MKQEFSAGGIVYKIGDDSGSARATPDRRIFILVIKPANSKRTPEDPKWGFPKGHVGDKHGGETVEESALREVREEGGVEARIIQKLDDIHYTYTWDNEPISKIVSYFLMEYVSGDIADHDHEVEKVEWLPLDEVEARIHWPGDKQIFNQAKAILSNA